MAVPYACLLQEAEPGGGCQLRPTDPIAIARGNVRKAVVVLTCSVGITSVALVSAYNEATKQSNLLSVGMAAGIQRAKDAKLSKFHYCWASTTAVALYRCWLYCSCLQSSVSNNKVTTSSCLNGRHRRVLTLVGQLEECYRLHRLGCASDAAGCWDRLLSLHLVHRVQRGHGIWAS